MAGADAFRLAEHRTIMARRLTAMTGGAEHLEIVGRVSASQRKRNDVVDLPPCAGQKPPAAALAQASGFQKKIEPLRGREGPSHGLPSCRRFWIR